MPEKIVGGAVDEEKENALGVETECAVEKVGLETVVMELLVDDVITNVSPNQKVIDHVLWIQCPCEKNLISKAQTHFDMSFLS